MDDSPKRELMALLADLAERGSGSDVTIICNGVEYGVHKAVICPASAFFTAACNDAVQQQQQQEQGQAQGQAQVPGQAQAQAQAQGQSPPIVLHFDDDDRRSVHLMIYYFYNLSYPTPSLDSPFNSEVSAPGWGNRLEIHAKLYALADKYAVDGLKDLAHNRFKRDMNNYWQIGDFIRATDYVYTAIPEGDRNLRDPIVNMLVLYRDMLYDYEVKAMVKRLGCLGYDLLVAQHWFGDRFDAPIDWFSPRRWV